MVLTSMSQLHSAEFVSGFAIRFFIGHDCLQVFSQSGGVLRGFTQRPSLNHASSMANGHPALLHFISVRTGLVRGRCYYILC